MRRISALWLGRRRYADVHALQHRLHAARREGRIDDVVLFLEHDAVITKGRGSHESNILALPAALRAAGIDLESTGRGGDVTLHAPGQLVCYPILDLNPDRRDVRRYVQDLTTIMRRTIAEDGIDSGAVEGMVGLWVNRDAPQRWLGTTKEARLAKIGAIGVHMSRWVTMHGFALNVSVDLSLYRFIVPCGISAFPVTSLAALTGGAPATRDIAERSRCHLAAVLDAEVTPMLDRSSSALEPGMLGGG